MKEIFPAADGTGWQDGKTRDAIQAIKISRRTFMRFSFEW
jgi:hypothetical protein